MPQVHKIVDATGTLPPIRIEDNNHGGISMFVESSEGDARFFTLNPGGGHWEPAVLKSLSGGTGLILDGDGYPMIGHGN